jgi:hypothetical protein
MTLEENSERADALAEEIVMAWGQSVSAGHGAKMSAEFKALFEKARRYRDAKQVADMHRGLGMLSEKEAGEEKSARQAFMEAHSKFSQKYPPSA